MGGLNLNSIMQWLEELKRQQAGALPDLSSMPAAQQQPPVGWQGPIQPPETVGRSQFEASHPKLSALSSLGQSLGPLIAGAIGGPRVGYGMLEGQRIAEQQALRQQQVAAQQAEIESQIQHRRKLEESYDVDRRRKEITDILDMAAKFGVDPQQAAAAYGITDENSLKAMRSLWERFKETQDADTVYVDLATMRPQTGMDPANPNLIPTKRSELKNVLSALKGNEQFVMTPNGDIFPATSVPDQMKDKVGPPMPLEAIKTRIDYLKTVNKPATYQDVEIVAKNAPGGHRTVLQSPSGTFHEQGTMAVIPGAVQIWKQPAVSMSDEATQARELVAQSLAHGDLSRLRDIASLRGDQRLLIYARAKQINPQFNTADIDRQIKMEEAVTVGKDGQQIQSFGTFLEHAGAAKEASDALKRTSSRAFNRPLNWWRENMSGDPNYQQFIAALEPVRKEFEGFLLGGRALYQDDRTAAERILSDNASPAQIDAALTQLGHTAAARFNEINYRYKRVRKQDIADPFAPEAIEGARKIGVQLGRESSSGKEIKVQMPDGSIKVFDATTRKLLRTERR